MWPIKWHGAALVVALALGATDIAHAQSFDVPPGRLGDVAIAIGMQAGVTVGVADRDVADQRSPGVKGKMSIRQALVRALRGTKARAVFRGNAAVGIVRQEPAPLRRRRSLPVPPLPTVEGNPAIVVTASKQGQLLDRYPGSVQIVDLDAGWVAANGADGTEALTKLLPIIGSTNLGTARNKLFIRGIADSSFNGPTQATVGQYLGDVRLNYNAPDPNLNLYDMKRIEVLIGPQGTLYGASSLGGIIRVEPNLPDTREASATLSTGGSLTRFGGLSVDGAALINLPVVKDRVAARLVAYSDRKAGYIDDPSRGLHDINSSLSYGGRLAWRIEDLSGVTVDLGFAVQNTEIRDGQYSLRGEPPLTRRSAIAQPFKNTYYLSYLTARRTLGRVELVSTTSIVQHDLNTVFDATGQNGSPPHIQFEENNNITLISHETRISGGDTRSPWVAGVSSIFSDSKLSRSLGLPAAPRRIAGVVNRQLETAAFGQGSMPLTSTLTATLGGRLTFALSKGNLLDDPVEASKEPFRTDLRIAGIVALDWHPPGSFSAFFHYQQGYRPGGLAVAPSGSGLESHRFATDDLNMSEIGIRLGDPLRSRLSARAALFYTRWNHIQADLVDAVGLPYTANIGSGYIFGLDGEVKWRPSRAFTLNVTAFFNNSYLYTPLREFAAGKDQTLPNVARSGVRISGDWQTTVAPGIILTSDASVRYVGKSRLGVGPLLDISQGNYFVSALSVRLDLGRFAFSLNIENLADEKANTFAFGNPFSLARRDQMTPLRPRTVRLGFDARF